MTSQCWNFGLIATAVISNGEAMYILVDGFSGMGRYVDGMNLYQYVGSDPVVLRDPSGLFVLPMVGMSIAEGAYLDAVDAQRVGVASAFLLAALGSYITGMQWGVGGGMSGAGFDVFLAGVDAFVAGQHVVGEQLMWSASVGALITGKLTGNLAEAAAALGIPLDQLRKAVHALKRKLGLGGAYNVQIDTVTGDIYVNDEHIGNVWDALDGYF